MSSSTRSWGSWPNTHTRLDGPMVITPRDVARPLRKVASMRRGNDRATAEDRRNAVSDYNAQIIDEFRANEGRVGRGVPVADGSGYTRRRACADLSCRRIAWTFVPVSTA